MPWSTKYPDLKNDPSYLEPRVSNVEMSLAQKAQQKDLDTTNANVTANTNAIVTKVDKVYVDSQSALKRDKATLLTMADLAQDVKTGMTGGGVAVVGTGAVSYPNLANDLLSQQKLLYKNSDFITNADTWSNISTIYTITKNANSVTYVMNNLTNTMPWIYKRQIISNVNIGDKIKVKVKVKFISSTIPTAQGQQFKITENYSSTEQTSTIKYSDIVLGQTYELDIIATVANIPSNSTWVSIYAVDQNVGTGQTLQFEIVDFEITKLIMDASSDIGLMQGVNYADFANIANTANSATIANALDSTYRSGIINDAVNQVSNPTPPSEADCWGDSLTAGAGTTADSNKYPQTLANLLSGQLTVNNLGIAGEKTSAISARQGGTTIYVDPFTIQANNGLANGVKVTLRTPYGDILPFTGNGGYNFGTVTIAGISGYISQGYVNGVWQTDGLYFVRNTSGSSVTLNRPTKVYVDTATTRANGINIIWAGTNDKPDSTSVSDVISKIKNMIEVSKFNKYIVIGLTSKSYMPDIDNVNIKLGLAFGRHFLNIRDYLLNYGLSDAGLTPTSQDNTDIANGEIPSSLRSDSVHLNDKSYPIVAQQVYNKGKELSYWS